MDRATIIARLADARGWTLTTLRALDPQVLHAPLTPSEHDPSNRWSPLDHFAHLALIETDFNEMIRRHVAGNGDPVGLRRGADGQPRSREQIMAYVHSRTEAFQRTHHDDSVDEVIALTGEVRNQTLALLDELTDAQLAETLPGAPWADGTVGGVLATNADHARQHFGWVADALAASR